MATKRAIRATRRTRWRVWLRSLIDRLLGIYYEGPSSPPRLLEELHLWAILNPDADHETLIGYCGCLLDGAYRDGFVRGYEWHLRSYDRDQPTPELLREMAGEDVSLATADPRIRAILEAGNDPDDPTAGVSATDRERYLAYIQQRQAYRGSGEPEPDDEI